MYKKVVNINGVNTNNLKVLTHEEMISLFKKYKEGDISAKDELVSGNLKLVLSILKKYNNRSEYIDDLFQIGVVGLIKAVDNFDLSHEVRFSTYAVLMIEGEIKRYIRDNNSLRISRSIKDLSYKILKLKESYINEYGVEPSTEFISKSLGVSNYEVVEALLSLKEPDSLFEPIYNDGGDTIYLLDQIEDKSKTDDLNKLLCLREALNKIKEREKTVLLKRYIDGMSQSEIANELNISQAQVSRIESTALTSVKRLIL